MFKQIFDFIIDRISKIITGTAPVISLFYGSKIKDFFTSRLDMRKQYLISRRLILDIANEKSLNPFWWRGDLRLQRGVIN